MRCELEKDSNHSHYDRSILSDEDTELSSGSSSSRDSSSQFTFPVSHSSSNECSGEEDVDKKDSDNDLEPQDVAADSNFLTRHQLFSFHDTVLCLRCPHHLNNSPVGWSYI